MNFQRIFNGMVGRDFITAFNDNFTICDETFLSILATLLYKVKSTDIKEFKVIDGVCSYTLEEEDPEAEEDTRTWIPIDITQWGNISGTLSDQTDLQAALDSKAAYDTVETMNNLLTTLNQDFLNLKDKVETNETTLNNVANDTADLMVEIQTKVNSTNIKAIRLNNAVFQWSPDGINWYEQPVVTTISWGHLVGDINSQEDLMHLFDVVNNTTTSLGNSITSINNTLSTLSDSVSTLTTTLNTHLTQDAADKAAINTRLGTIQETAEGADTKATTAKNLIDGHLEDYNNPHHITKTTIGLSNVDNTADMEKPLSTPQKLYVDTEIEKIIDESFSGIPIVKRAGSVNYLFVGSQAQYQSTPSAGSSDGYLSFILDDEFLKFDLYLKTELYNIYDSQYGLKTNEAGAQIITPTVEETGIKYYHDLTPDNSYILVLNPGQGSPTEVNIPIAELTKNTTLVIDDLYPTLSPQTYTLDSNGSTYSEDFYRKVKPYTRMRLSYKLTAMENLPNDKAVSIAVGTTGGSCPIVDITNQDTPSQDLRTVDFIFVDTEHTSDLGNGLMVYVQDGLSGNASVTISDITLEVISENDEIVFNEEGAVLDSNNVSETLTPVKNNMVPGTYKVRYDVTNAVDMSDTYSLNWYLTSNEGETISLPSEYEVSAETKEYTFTFNGSSTDYITQMVLDITDAVHESSDAAMTISNIRVFKVEGGNA